MVRRALNEVELVSQPVEHRAVLPGETLAMLAPRPGDIVVDATLGAGGHSEALLEAVTPGGRLIGIDRDPIALAIARRRLARFGDAFSAIHGNHDDLERLLDEAGVQQVDRILLDLGLSSMQLDDPARGFSFRADGPLDMRMDPASEWDAAELLASWPEERIRAILWQYGEERRARAIARAIVRERAHRPLVRTLELAELVERTLGPSARRWRIHPATRTFQALRIAVNGEIDGLETLIERAVGRLRVGGRIAAISFHSLEDRAIKRALRAQANPCSCPPGLPVCGCGRQSRVRILTGRPLRPSEAEVADNARARSAKLRAAERI